MRTTRQSTTGETIEVSLVSDNTIRITIRDNADQILVSVVARIQPGHAGVLQRNRAGECTPQEAETVALIADAVREVTRGTGVASE